MDQVKGEKVGFFKTYSYEITKLFINQVGITIFALVLYTAAGSIEDNALFSKLRVILSVFSALFFYALIYTAAWDYGARDKIKIDSGKLSMEKNAGLKMAIIANIPNFVAAGLSALFMGLYMLTNAEGLYTAFAVFNLIIRFISAMFLGIIQGIFSFLETSDTSSRQYLLYFFWQSVAYFIVPLFTIAVTHIGYVFGLKEKKIFNFASVKKKEK